MADYELTQEDIKEIIEHLEDGKTRKEIAELFEVSTSKISAIAKENGFSKPSNSTQRVSDQDIARMVELRKEGVSGVDIAKQFGVDFSTVYRYLRKHKIGREFGDGRVWRDSED